MSNPAVSVSMRFLRVSQVIPRRTRSRIAGIAILVPLLSGCGYEEHVWNQKQTVTVQTPTGEVSGSSVTRIKALFGEQPMSGNEVVYSVTGEATVVEVRPGRYLFALLEGSDERYYWAVAEKLEGKSRGEWLGIIPQMKDIAVLDPERHGYPLLVTFDDLSDPTTVREVDPNDLAATFGAGYSLKSITLEITETKISDGVIEELLPWWCAIRGKLLDGSNIVRSNIKSSSNKISGGEFRIGECS